MDRRIGEIERHALSLRMDLRRLSAAAPEARQPVQAPEPDALRPVAPRARAPRPRPSLEVDLGALADRLATTRGLAWTGAVVTLLGIVFFYAVANDRGWVGPGGRV